MIPNHFHFIFGLKQQTEPFHPCYYLCLESCRQVVRPDRIFFYYHYEPYGEYWEIIKSHLELVRVELVPFVSNFKYGFKNRVVRKYSYAHHSDFIRLQVLQERGGVYADIDTIFINPIPQHLFTKDFVLGREDDLVRGSTRQPSLCNAFIMASRNSQFGQSWLQQMQESFDGQWSSHSTLLPQRLSEQYPEWIHIEPSRTFYKHMWTPQGLHTLLKGYDADHTGVVSFHLWSHLWWDETRTDFSDIHAGMFTEDYIRTVDTTYNRIARKYLPLNKP